ncbi:MAG: heme exporter protein CcmD [Thiohalocapsa sp.]
MMEAAVDFFRQGGYAFFVWGAFGVTFLLMLAEVAQLRQNRRTILSRVGRLVRLRSPAGTSPTGAHPSVEPETAPMAEPRGKQT